MKFQVEHRETAGDCNHIGEGFTIFMSEHEDEVKKIKRCNA